jgi:Ca2+-binding RTX toxin-like protein
MGQIAGFLGYRGVAGRNEHFDVISETFIDGNDGNDYILSSEATDFAIGGLGSDFISSTGGNDIAYGDRTPEDSLGSADAMNGGGGDDTLFGGGGNDLLSGSSGADLLFGGAGDDLGYGGIGNDSIDGGDGNDTLFGGTDTVINVTYVPGISMTHNGENDTLSALSISIVDFGLLVATTNTGDDLIRGGLGNDTIHGQDGFDTHWKVALAMMR